MKKLFISALFLCFSVFLSAQTYNTREYWVQTLIRISDPVLTAMSESRLKTSMPFESKSPTRRSTSHIEAFARTLNGIAPWLELGADETPEGKLRAKYIALARKALANAVDSTSADYCDFSRRNGPQPLVEAAFLSQALLRAPKQVWEPLDATTKTNVIRALRSSRDTKPYESNWLLFSAMVEAFMLQTGNEWKSEPIEYALKKHAEWYKGDGAYGDGSEFHWDYYNSFVIEPMLIDVVKTMDEHKIATEIPYNKVLKRAQRYAAVQERLISPEGTYPPIGRSLAYRFGAFQALAQMALMQQLPSDISPAQVRSALSEVIHRQVETKGTFDSNGWLTIGFFGHQPSVGENYISTGSVYLCTAALLPLGLAAENIFWSGAATAWTSKKAWAGEEFKEDQAYRETSK